MQTLAHDLQSIGLGSPRVAIREEFELMALEPERGFHFR
jgi:hypothetical protein